MLAMDETSIWVILTLFIFGLCAGSFVNAAVWRLRQQDLLAKKPTGFKKNKEKKLAAADFSILSGRSMCPNCKHTLAWVDLIPLISWISLKGKCRYCKKPISSQYPLVELVLAIIFVYSYLVWPISFGTTAGLYSLTVWLVASVGLMILAIYDLKWTLLPTTVSYALITFTVIARIGYIGLYEPRASVAILNWALAVAVSSGLFFILYKISKGKWIGDGDITLGIISGTLLAKPSLSFLMIFLASILGTLTVIPGLITGKKTLTARIPFGPFLIVATFITLLFGQELLDWYLGLTLQG